MIIFITPLIFDNNAQSADMVLEIPQGKTELLAYFEMEDDTESNAFYVVVEKL